MARPTYNGFVLLVLATLSALAHPSAAAHLHATEPIEPCDDQTRLRRAAALFDSRQLDAAQGELDALCHPEDEAARLARARLQLARQSPERALALVSDLRSLDAATLRASALVQLDRPDDAAAELASTLARQPSLRPDDYLDAARPLADATALEVLELGLDTLGPVGALQRAAAERLAGLGRLDDARALLSDDRIADLVLEGDLLATAGRSAAADRAWRQAGALVDGARPSRAMDTWRRAIDERLSPEPQP